MQTKTRKTVKLTPSRKQREGGVILFLGCLCLPVIMGMLAVSVDLSVLYSVKARLQTACDGAAVAALRSVSLGQTIASQSTAATNVANSWFRANFSNGFMGTTNTSNPPTVAVAQDNVTLLTTVDVTASTTVPTFFMKYWNAANNVITAHSQASRRNVVVTLVLDRSGSMTNANNSYNGQTPCQVMVTAAKQFTGMFQPTRDYIGLVSFAGSVYVASSPTTNFQTTLGYSNSAGSGTGLLDNISCSGGTNTPAAISVAWNENYKIQLPGALNVILLMTDGQPTAATYKFITTAAQDPTGTAQSAFSSSSTCQDSAGRALNSTGNMVTNPRNFIGSRQQLGATANTINLGTNSYTGWNAITGPIGAVYADGSGFYGGWPFLSPTSTLLENVGLNSTEAPGCGFNNGSWSNSPTPDIAWIPPYDLFGNATTGYITSGYTTSTLSGATRIPMNSTNLNTVIENVTDNAANWARTNHMLPNGSTVYGGNLIFTVGLGGNGGVNHTLLQRIANDPNQSPDNGATYSAYAGYNNAQPVGTYIYSADSSQLSAAFMKIASQILRLSK